MIIDDKKMYENGISRYHNVLMHTFHDKTENPELLS